MRVFAVTLGFAPSRVLRSSIAQVYKTIGIKPQHLLLNNHYPVDKHKNTERVQELCVEFGIRYFDQGQNLGLQGGYNYLIESLDLQPNDVVIGIDPDVYPVTQGWGRAIVDVCSDQRVGWASLMTQVSEREIRERGSVEMTIGGHVVQEPHSPCINSICAWRGDILQATKGLKEPKKYYGGIECMMWPMIKRMGKKWVYLKDFKEEWHVSIESEPLYKQYKQEYARNNTTNLDFEAWLHLRSSQ